MRSGIYRLFVVATLVFGVVFAASAREVGHYSYVQINADGGGVAAGSPIGLDSNPAIWVSESAEGVSPQALAGGAPWFCTTPGCSVSVGSLAGLGWAEASADAAARRIGGRAGAYQNGGPAPLNYVDFLGVGVPVDPWGTAAAYGYISELVEVTSDGTLAPGAAVSVRANAALSGEFTDDLFTSPSPPAQVPTGRVHVAVFVSRIGDFATDPYWNSGPYLTYGGVTDIIGDPATHGGELLDRLSYVTDSLTSAVVAFDADLFVTANVGDRLLFETILYTESVLRNDEGGHTAWSEFGETLGVSYTAVTAGAGLRTVPVPASLPLLSLALAGLWRARRRRIR